MLRTNSGNEKPHLSWIETDLCKSVHWAPTPTSLCPGTPVTCFDKACWNKLSLARQRWACHPPAASPAAAGMALRAAGDAVPLRCGNPPMPTKKGVSRVFVSVTGLCDWIHCQPTMGPWMREDSNPVYLSLHLHMSPPVRAWSLQVTQTEVQQMTTWENVMLLGPYDLLSQCC